MDKVDFKKTLAHLYTASRRQFEEVDVPPLAFLMVDGVGSPGEAPEYARALEWLYGVSYPLKFLSKQALGRDFAVMPLEGLWWAQDMTAFTEPGRRDEWRWTLMIMQPDWIGPDLVAGAIAKAAAKRGDPPPSLRLARLTEGRSLQKLHVGPFADEAPVLRQLHHEIMPSLGLAFAGHHHEIYLSDPRRCAPERMRTILRQPVCEASKAN